MRAQRRIGVTILGLTALTLLLGGAERAAADVIVVPNAQTASDGNFGIEGGADSRFQEVFSASQFAGLGPITITQIAFRPSAILGSAFGPTTDHGVRFDLSTTAAAPGALSTTFANNVGPDDTVVFNGDWTRSSAFTNGPGNTKAFDITLALTTPFVYDPSKGNLLLDTRNPSGDAVFPVSFDVEMGAGTPVDLVFGSPSTSATGITFDSEFGVPGGPVVQFTFAVPFAVPEPSSLALFGLGAAALALWRRRRRA